MRNNDAVDSSDSHLYGDLLSLLAALLAAFLFGELPSWIQILGGVLILAGVYGYSRIERKEKK